MTRKELQTIQSATTLDAIFPVAAKLEGDAATVALHVGRIMSADGAPKRADAMETAKRHGYRAGKSAGYYSQVVGAYRWSKRLDGATLEEAYQAHGYYALYRAAGRIPKGDSILSLEDVARIIAEDVQTRTGGKGKGTGKGKGRKSRSAATVADSQDSSIPHVTVTLHGDAATALQTLAEAADLPYEEVLASILGDALKAYQAV